MKTEKTESFWEKLESFGSLSVNDVSPNFDEENRSSTIFPVYKLEEAVVSISFLSYWVQKHGNDVAIKLTARDMSGKVRDKTWFPVTSLKAYDFRADRFPFFENAGEGFCGSVEFEVFSSSRPYFTFPAVTLNFVHEKGSSCVHSCMRSLNKNEAIQDYAIGFPQTGFDVLLGPDKKNFLCFFGGKKERYNLKLVLEQDGSEKTHKLVVENCNFLQMHVVYVEDIFPDAKVGVMTKVTIDHDLDVFPRFYVGTEKTGHVPSLTHTFFDTSEQQHDQLDEKQEQFRAENTNSSEYYDAAFMVPIYTAENFDTTLSFYRQNLHFKGDVELRILSDEGMLINRRFLSGEEVDNFNDFATFNLAQEVKTLGVADDKPMSAFFGFSGAKMPFPRRFKLALNLKRHDQEIGSNICFSPLVQRGTMMEKPFARRWFPLGGEQQIGASLHFTRLDKGCLNEEIDVLLEFINETGEKLTRSISTISNASIFLNIESDPELKLFFQGRIGWCFSSVNSYMADSFFFSFAGDHIGGDHSF